MNTEHGYNVWAAFRGGVPAEKVDHLSEVVLEALPYTGGTVSASEAGIDLRFPITADRERSLVEVAGVGEQIASRAVGETGLELRLEALQVLTDDELDREVSTPNFPELVGMSEIAEILGVTRQRVNQLRTRDDFPVPVAELKAGSVWARPMLERFIEEWPRKGGRAPAWWVGTFYALDDEAARVMSAEQLTNRLARLRTMLLEKYPKAEAHGRPERYAVGVFLRAYDEQSAKDQWFREVDPIIDRAGVGWSIARHVEPVQAVQHAEFPFELAGRDGSR